MRFGCVGNWDTALLSEGKVDCIHANPETCDDLHAGQRIDQRGASACCAVGDNSPHIWADAVQQRVAIGCLPESMYCVLALQRSHTRRDQGSQHQDFWFHHYVIFAKRRVSLSQRKACYFGDRRVEKGVQTRESDSAIRHQSKSLFTFFSSSSGDGGLALEFGHFPMTAERSNRIVQAAVATLWRPGLICLTAARRSTRQP